MGRTTRWLKSLFGIKKDKQNSNSNSSSINTKGGGAAAPTPTPPPHSDRGLCHNPATIPPNISPAEAAWLQSFYSETDKEQNKHAIAVAAATAAAADAAVAAAQAAVAVVRLTSHGRGTLFGGGGHQKLAAVKIQTTFRGYLARKALRALKGLVKLQAVVRGYLVRKQASATLYSMQALIRAQATVRSHKSRGNRFHIQTQPRTSTERYDESSTASIPPIHSRRLSSSFDAAIAVDGSPKIVEVDTVVGRPKSISCSRSRRSNCNTSMSDFGDETSFQMLLSSSPLQPITCRTPADRDWGLTVTGEEECSRSFSTAQSTPRFNTTRSSCSCGFAGAGAGAGATPLTPRTVCSTDSSNLNLNYFGEEYGNFPNYMANTKSFKAKLRSHSAPKQRPEPGPKKQLSLSDMMESRTSFSGVRMQRSCSQIQDAINFKNAVMSKLDRSTDFGIGRRETDSTNNFNFSNQKRW